MKILLAVDNKKVSQQAIQAICLQNDPSQTAVRVLHVVEPFAIIPPPQMAANFAPEKEDETKEWRAFVTDVAKKLQKAGFKAEGAVETGEAQKAILQSAAEWHADLIMMGSHGRKGIKRLLLGSVAESVVRNALCSVEVLRSAA